MFEICFQVVETQTTTAYRRILPTLSTTFEMSLQLFRGIEKKKSVVYIISQFRQ
jgi:hypothetical protein